ncbi:hypothetical protein QTG54_004335 [Skeletonema marinoi]|uniref:Wbp11/ELF5/Saf1 N-terminal domain-containing protein n=1 Tax=Skeletonema marinoi TaxID=267567 RepID=A0AAD8YEI2_9STRA|nr:hypothetical protein QTG54_004335 [Skeletonema marinoi]
MAKSENPLDVYRRQQRKKELKKNKNARIKARDEKVAATRAIDEPGRQRGDNEGDDADEDNKSGGLDSNETKKLERLRKELKIVTAASARRKELHEQAQREKELQLIAAQKTVEGVQKLNESKYSVLERYASVYYDEKMNPFGALLLEGRRCIGVTLKKETTMNARMAVVPSQLQQKLIYIRDRCVLHHHLLLLIISKTTSASITATTSTTIAPPPPPPPPPPPQPQTKDENGQPLMPAPSKAVIRAAKRNKTSAMADIWASTEEMQYEKSLGVDLEGALDEQQQASNSKTCHDGFGTNKRNPRKMRLM